MKVQRLSFINRIGESICGLLRYKVTRGASVQLPLLGNIQRPDGAFAPARVAVTKSSLEVTLRQQCLSIARGHEGRAAASRRRDWRQFIRIGCCILAQLVHDFLWGMSPSALFPIAAIAIKESPAVVRTSRRIS